MKFYFDTSFSNSGLTFLRRNPFIGCAAIELWFPTYYSLLTTNSSLLTKN
jgi:hypothetical protein